MLFKRLLVYPNLHDFKIKIKKLLKIIKNYNNLVF